MLGELIKVLILDRDKVLSSDKTILDDRSSTSGKINADARKCIAKNGCGCDSCHFQKFSMDQNAEQKK
jgi:hypothetical protein